MRFYATQCLFMLKMNSKCSVLQARVHTRIRVSVHARASGCFFCLSLLTHNVSDKSTSTRVDGSHVRRPPEYACIQKCIQEHSIFARTGNRCRHRRLYVLPIAAISLSDPSSDEKDVTFCSSLKTLGRKKTQMHETYFWNKSPNTTLTVVTLCLLSDSVVLQLALHHPSRFPIYFLELRTLGVSSRQGPL